MDPVTTLPEPTRARVVPLGRKAVISREDIMEAALKLLGPHRSMSTLSLREVAREAGIAPNSFYRQFRDMDELAIALIVRAGKSLRRIIGEARHRASSGQSVVRGSVDAFMKQLRSDDKLLHMLLREGTVGSAAYKQAVERELLYFEEELRQDLIRLAELHKTGLYEPAVTAKAITRLVFAMGTTAMDLPEDKHAECADQMALMVRMIVVGTQTLATHPELADRPD
ncbi:MAG: HTH-type transcriptional repressor FabR [Acidobacteriota bacterium]